MILCGGIGLGFSGTCLATNALLAFLLAMKWKQDEISGRVFSTYRIRMGAEVKLLPISR
jgi:hypothetical protein